MVSGSCLLVETCPSCRQLVATRQDGKRQIIKYECKDKNTRVECNYSNTIEMADAEEERLKKLMDRTNNPLPAYSQFEGMNKAHKVAYTGSDSEHADVNYPEPFSERKNKRAMNLESNQKQTPQQKRDENTNHQKTLDEFNFCTVPVIRKTVKLNSHSEHRLIAEGSNSLSANDSSQQAPSEMAFSGNVSDGPKISDYFPDKGRQIAQTVPPAYLDYIAKEKAEFVQKLNAQNRKIEELQEAIDMKDKEIKRLKELIKKDPREAEKSHRDRLINIVLELEEYRRRDRASRVQSMHERLGYSQQTEAGPTGRAQAFWVHGSEIKPIRERLEAIQEEKNRLEALKKNMKSKKLTKRSIDCEVIEDYNEEEDENSMSTSIITDTKEATKRLDNVIETLKREEQMLRDKLEALEKEKIILTQEEKLLKEEALSTYGKANPAEGRVKYPIFRERYQLVGLLGKGGFSEVYKAFDLDKFNYKAVKMHRLQANWDAFSKMNYIRHATREFNVQKNIVHENIIRQYESIELSESEFATVLEYCEGPDLSTYLKRNGMIPEKEAKTIIKQVLCALKCLSEHKDGKIIHYDLKPGNILFKNGFVKVADFGLCKLLDPGTNNIDLTSYGVGTYWYLPPETFLAETPNSPPQITPKVDIWSVGVIFFEMLYAMKPFGHGMSQNEIMRNKVMLRATKVEFPQKPNVTQETKEFIKGCLEYSADRRLSVQEAYDLLCK